MRETGGRGMGMDGDRPDLAAFDHASEIVTETDGDMRRRYGLDEDMTVEELRRDVRAVIARKRAPSQCRKLDK